MGRRSLLIVLLLGACSPSSGPFGDGPVEELPPRDRGLAVPAAEDRSLAMALDFETGHEDLDCATCHWGRRADVGMRSVPPSTCSTAGCHTDGGPAQVEFLATTFEHRNHADTAAIAIGCASCHTHAVGAAPIDAGADACALCHSDQLDGAVPAECRSCHVHPDHMASTSQGVVFAHDALPWVTGGCVRCHYDVAQPRVAVEDSKCAACHTDVGEVVEMLGDEDVHPSHTGLNCVGCHEQGLHSIRAMTSAVALECSDCHQPVHEIEATPEWPGTPTCNACHTGIHGEQQRLLLGLLPGIEQASPSEKFMDGMTCRSCHVPSANRTTAGAGLPGTRESCIGCHEQRFGQVLTWWRQGAAERAGLVSSYLSGAEGALASAADSAALLLAVARERFDLIAMAQPEHNLTAAHQGLESVLADAAEAYRAAGRTPPTPPAIGRAPTMGVCSFCHYRLGETTLTQSMPQDFHRRLMVARGR